MTPPKNPSTSIILDPNKVSQEQIALIHRTIAKDATTDELKLFLYDCSRQGVHPLDGLIHFSKRAGRYKPIASIDFMRIRAHDTGLCSGISDPEFKGTPKEEGFQATVTVRRIVDGQSCEFTATARWEEYVPGDKEGFMWKKMPHLMLGKVAESLALRKAFPKQLARLYAPEEMDQIPHIETPEPTKSDNLKSDSEDPLPSGKPGTNDASPSNEELALQNLETSLDEVARKLDIDLLTKWWTSHFEGMKRLSQKGQQRITKLYAEAKREAEKQKGGQ